MVYSEVIKNNWHLLLPKKAKYTKADYKKLLKEYSEFTYNQAFFIVKCIAVFHDADFSRFFHSIDNIILA